MPGLTIHDIARKFETMFPYDVDTNDFGDGRQEEGIKGIEGDPAVIWHYFGAGKFGHGLIAFPADAVQRAAEVILGLKDSANFYEMELALTAAKVPYECLI